MFGGFYDAFFLRVSVNSYVAMFGVYLSNVVTGFCIVVGFCFVLMVEFILVGGAWRLLLDIFFSN